MRSLTAQVPYPPPAGTRYVIVCLLRMRLSSIILRMSFYTKTNKLFDNCEHKKNNCRHICHHTLHPQCKSQFRRSSTKAHVTWFTFWLASLSNRLHRVLPESSAHPYHWPELWWVKVNGRDVALSWCSKRYWTHQTINCSLLFIANPCWARIKSCLILQIGWQCWYNAT